jgi:hypothetical protein
MLPYVLLAGFLCILSIIFPSKATAGNEYYADPVKGNNANPGTLSAPYKTVAKSISRLTPGDTLYLREGTYRESDISIAVHGTASGPITIRNYPGEKPIIDGGYGEFRTIGNDDWELADVSTHLYRSRKTYPDPGLVHGYLEWDERRYKMVPYESFGHIATANQYYTETGNTYVGPGTCWKRSEQRIYVRLQQTNLAMENRYDLPGLPPDPRQVKLYLFPGREVLLLRSSAAYLHLEGLNIRFQNNAIEILSGAHLITVKNCQILGGRYHILAREGTHDLLFDGITIDDGVPDWIAWTDVKSGQKPAHSFQNAAFNLRSYNVEVKNCTFNRLFDGFNGSAENAHIHHNVFRDIRDDCFQFATHSYGVEIAYNKMIHVSKGPGFQGTTDSEKPGTKYYHHNIIDCSKLWQYTRKKPDGQWGKKPSKKVNERGQGWAKPFGAHGVRGTLDPLKIYHNTIIFGSGISGWGAGHEYNATRFDPEVPQEVYNNIIIQIADAWAAGPIRVADGSQIHDGNLYYRSFPNPAHPFFRGWFGESGPQDFTSLAEYHTSPLFAESRSHYPPGFENSGTEGNPGLNNDYRPDPKSPAATGAVALPADWPGNKAEAFRGALSPPY